MVCGFVAPPKAFQDPNVDIHKQLDLRQQQADAAPGAMPASPGQAPDPTAADMPGTLTCPNCGYETESAAPMSVDTADVQGMPEDDPQQGEQGDVEALDSQQAAPQEGDPTQEPEDPTQDEAGDVGATEGDLCPNCGQAPLESANVLAEEGGMPPNADGVPDDEEMPPGDNDAVGGAPADDEDLDDQDPEQGPGDAGKDESSDEPWPDDNDDPDDSDDDSDDDEDDEKPPKKGNPFK